MCVNSRDVNKNNLQQEDDHDTHGEYDEPDEARMVVVADTFQEKQAMVVHLVVALLTQLAMFCVVALNNLKKYARYYDSFVRAMS